MDFKVARRAQQLASCSWNANRALISFIPAQHALVTATNGGVCSHLLLAISQHVECLVVSIAGLLLATAEILTECDKFN